MGSQGLMGAEFLSYQMNRAPGWVVGGAVLGSGFDSRLTYLFLTGVVNWYECS